MAKLNHVLFGQAKGKVGGLVLQRYEGMNIAREKPISVKNPQSTKQTEQRAKFKSASQIVAQFKEALNMRLSKISIYTRDRRSAALNAIISVVEVEPTSASTLFENILNSINGKSMATIEAPIMGAGADNTITITAFAGDIVTYVATNYDADGKLISREVENYTSDGTAKEVTPDDNADTFGIIAVATRATTEAGRATFANIAGVNNEFLLDIARAVNAGDAEVSDAVGGMRQLS